MPRLANLLPPIPTLHKSTSKWMLKILSKGCFGYNELLLLSHLLGFTRVHGTVGWLKF